MSRSSYNNTAQYLLNNNIIDSRESIKDLGIMITSDLSWSTHCNMVVSRAYKQLGLIRCSFKIKKIIHFLGVLTTYVLLSDLATQPGSRHTAFGKSPTDSNKVYYSSSHKIRLSKLSMLPFMFVFELNDLLFSYYNVHA